MSLCFFIYWCRRPFTDFLVKMNRARLLKRNPKNKTHPYECLVCNRHYNKTSLRFHVGRVEHKQMLMSYMGLSSNPSVVCLTEQWPMMKRLYRHSSYDRVILLADELLRPLLTPLARHDNKVGVTLAAIGYALLNLW